MKNPRFSSVNYKRLIPFLDAVDGTQDKHFKFTHGEYMPLSIENMETTFHGFPVYGMMHFYTQNGDLMRDPDMTFYVDRESSAIVPMTIQQDGVPFTKYGTLYKEVFDEHGECRRDMLHELDDFLNTWTRNILAQGFDPSQATQGEVTPEQFAASLAE